jgi:hypothetical protein
MRSGADPADTLRLAQNRALAQRIARVSRTRRKAMKREDVQAWIDAYVEAWRTYDPTEIAALFTENATYAYHPWDEGEAGPARLVGGALPAADGRGRSGSRYRHHPLHRRQDLLQPVGSPLRRRRPLRRVRRVVHGPAIRGNAIVRRERGARGNRSRRPREARDRISTR